MCFEGDDQFEGEVWGNWSLEGCCFGAGPLEGLMGHEELHFSEEIAGTQMAVVVDVLVLDRMGLVRYEEDSLPAELTVVDMVVLQIYQRGSLIPI